MYICITTKLKILYSFVYSLSIEKKNFIKCLNVSNYNIANSTNGFFAYSEISSDFWCNSQQNDESFGRGLKIWQR